MDRRRILACSGSLVGALCGCLNQEADTASDTTTARTTSRTDRGDDRGQTETMTTTMRATDQHLVFVNGDDERHDLRVTVSAADDDVLDQSTDLAADERRRFVLDIEEPGTYTVSAAVDGDATETWSISFDDYDVREGSDVFVEINDGRPDIYWEE